MMIRWIRSGEMVVKCALTIVCKEVWTIKTTQIRPQLTSLVDQIVELFAGQRKGME